MEIPSRKEQLLQYLKNRKGMYRIISDETGVKLSWIYCFTGARGINNPGVNQIDPLYDYMLQDLGKTDNQVNRAA